MALYDLIVEKIFQKPEDPDEPKDPKNPRLTWGMIIFFIFLAVVLRAISHPIR